MGYLTEEYKLKDLSPCDVAIRTRTRRHTWNPTSRETEDGWVISVLWAVDFRGFLHRMNLPR